MAVGFRNSAGTELDALFYPGNSGITTGFKRSDGVDLGSLFMAYTTGAKQGATGFKNSAGTDFADLFQNINVPPVTNHTTSIEQLNVVDYCFFDSGNFQYQCGCSQNLKANVSNGVGPFTYSWARISGDTQMQLANASSQTCQVSSINPNGVTDTYGATFRVTVTDTGNSNYQTTTDITISHTHDGV